MQFTHINGTSVAPVVSGSLRGVEAADGKSVDFFGEIILPIRNQTIPCHKFFLSKAPEKSDISDCHDVPVNYQNKISEMLPNYFHPENSNQAQYRQYVTSTVLMSEPRSLEEREGAVSLLAGNNTFIIGRICEPVGGLPFGNILTCGKVLHRKTPPTNPEHYTQGISISPLFFALVFINLVFCIPVAMMKNASTIQVIRVMSAFGTGVLMGDVTFRQLPEAYFTWQEQPFLVATLILISILVMIISQLVVHYKPTKQLGGGMYGPDFRSPNQKLSLASLNQSTSFDEFHNPQPAHLLVMESEARHDSYKGYRERIKNVTEDVNRINSMSQGFSRPLGGGAPNYQLSTDESDNIRGQPREGETNPAFDGFNELMKREKNAMVEHRAMLNRPTAAFACVFCAIWVNILRKLYDGIEIHDAFRSCTNPDEPNLKWLGVLHVMAHHISLEIVLFFVLVSFGKFSMVGAFATHIILALVGIGGACLNAFQEVPFSGRGAIASLSSGFTIFLAMTYLLPNVLAASNRGMQVFLTFSFILGAIIAGLPLIQKPQQCMFQNPSLTFRS